MLFSINMLSLPFYPYLHSCTSPSFLFSFLKLSQSHWRYSLRVDRAYLKILGSAFCEFLQTPWRFFRSSIFAFRQQRHPLWSRLSKIESRATWSRTEIQKKSHYNRGLIDRGRGASTYWEHYWQSVLHDSAQKKNYWK